MQENFNDWTFGIFLIVFALIGVVVVPAYNKMSEKFNNKSDDK